MKRKIGDTWYDLPDRTDTKWTRAGDLLGRMISDIDNWMPCDSCGCGALAHGYDEPAQRCLCGRCAGYKHRSGGPAEKSGPPKRL